MKRNYTRKFFSELFSWTRFQLHILTDKKTGYCPAAHCQYFTHQRHEHVILASGKQWCEQTKQFSYDPVTYWLKRGRHYVDEFASHDTQTKAAFAKQEKSFIDCLYSTASHFHTILSLGCGFGRMEKLILDHFKIERLVGLDISPEQIAIAQKAIRHSNAEFFVNDILRPLPYSDGEFDLVYASEVLMHLPKPLPVLREMLRVSNRYVASLDYFNPDSATPLAPHQFNHNLETMLRELNVPHVNTSIIPCPLNQRIILIDKIGGD